MMRTSSSTMLELLRSLHSFVTVTSATSARRDSIQSLEAGLYPSAGLFSALPQASLEATNDADGECSSEETISSVLSGPLLIWVEPCLHSSERQVSMTAPPSKDAKIFATIKISSVSSSSAFAAESGSCSLRSNNFFFSSSFVNLFLASASSTSLHGKSSPSSHTGTRACFIISSVGCGEKSSPNVSIISFRPPYPSQSNA
mmetsp:Transcript_50471/g.107496  ORF Transcript_50471/g.107496 Transcript_50471/m.107496 type:complete len:201 (-) Transcript_50471:132-734(-)